jgi:hypothetical protein
MSSHHLFLGFPVFLPLDDLSLAIFTIVYCLSIWLFHSFFSSYSIYIMYVHIFLISSLPTLSVLFVIFLNIFISAVYLWVIVVFGLVSAVYVIMSVSSNFKLHHKHGVPKTFVR